MAIRAKSSVKGKAPAAAPARPALHRTPGKSPPQSGRDAVSLLMQSKLTVNAPGDAYEREADSVAARIMQMPEHERTRRKTGIGSEGSVVQRQEEEEEAQTAPLQRQEEEEEEEEMQAAPLQRQEAEEEEMQTAALQRQEEEEEEMQMACASCRDERETPDVQRQEDAEEEEMQAAASAARAGRRRMSCRFEARLQHLKSTGGSPMQPGLRSFMESRFGHAFRNVRIHTGADAAGLAREARARAFTVGRHVVFNADEYRPDSDSGRRLMAHELTHVLQQQGGLHSVQRDIFAPERMQAVNTPRGEDLLRRLERVVGTEDGQLPPAITTVLRELLRSAANGPEVESLRGLLADEAVAAETRRLIQNTDYSLRLQVRRSERGSRAEWDLRRAGEEEPIFRHLVDLGGSASVPAGGVDEAQISITDALPPKYRKDSTVVPRANEPPSPPERAKVANPPEPAPQDAEGVDMSGLDEADSETGGSPATVENAAGRGDSVGEDAPEQRRPPVDEESEEPVAEESEVPEGPLKRAIQGGASSDIDPQAERQVTAVLNEPGVPLPLPLAAEIGETLGEDLSGLRIHHGPLAARAARDVGARAFALGDQVVFGAGQYQPATRLGRGLIAHELTHVRQFREGRGQSLLRRQEECPPPEPVPEVEVVPSPASAREDPAFTSMERRSENRANSQAAHGSGEGKSDDANAAARVTEGENQTHAQSDQVGTMATAAANPPVFDREAFIESVLSEVERIAPDTMNDVMEFKNRNTAGQVKSAVDGEAASAADNTQSPLNEAATEDPGPGESPRTQQPLAVEPPGPQPGSIRADRAMPPPRTESEVEMRADTVRTENILREACVTRDYMDEHGDPELSAAATAQDGLSEATEQAPVSYREQEAAALQSSRAGASLAGAQGVGDLFQSRAGNFADVGNAQGRAATENERKRQQVATEVNTIFTETQTAVTERLDTMTTDVNTTFDTEATAAVNTFEEFIRVNAEEYENNWFEDLVERASNWLLGPPPQEVWDFYAEGRRQFIADMRTAIGNVADIVATGLREARDLVDDGKRRVEEKLSTLGDDLADFRSEISDQMNERFSGLESDIAERQRTTVQNLGQRYAQAVEQMRAIEQQVRDEYSTWVDAAADAYNAAVDFISGWIDRLVSIVGDAATRIIREPGKFLRNLGAGIVQGLTMFMENIGDNIKSAVITWLTGNLGSAGIQVPSSFDARSIIGFALELVGLGLTNIKTIARRVFGRRVVAAIEAGVAGFERVKQLFDILVTEGPAGLYQHLRGEFERMKGEIMEKIGQALAQSLIVAGIKKVLGLISGLVSGGAGTVVTIVSTIIDLVLWFRDNAAQLAELVSTIAGMAMAVLNGQVGALANAVNSVLKRLLPVVLSFVGALVGIGGAVRKIQQIFRAIRRPATRAITALFRRMKRGLQRIIQRLTRRGRGRGRDRRRERRMSPRAVLRRIVSSLRQPSSQEAPARALSETRQLADRLTREYQPRLRRGRIRIDILDRSADQVASDGDVDFRVSVNPSSTGARRIRSNLQRRFSSQIGQTHDSMRPTIMEATGRITSGSPGNIRSWPALKRRLARDAEIGRNLARPVDGRLRFGRDVQVLVERGVKAEKPSAAPSAVRKARAEINAGRGFYAEPKEKFVALMWRKTNSQARIQSSVGSAFAETAKRAPTEPYNRVRHYGHTPTTADRAHFRPIAAASPSFGAGVPFVVDHAPPLVERYYEGGAGDREGFKLNDAQRFANARRRLYMQLQKPSDSHKQGGEMSAYSRRMRQRFGL